MVLEGQKSPRELPEGSVLPGLFQIPIPPPRLCYALPSRDRGVCRVQELRVRWSRLLVCNPGIFLLINPRSTAPSAWPRPHLQGRVCGFEISLYDVIMHLV